jgi:hypothetical protein
VSDKTKTTPGYRVKISGFIPSDPADFENSAGVAMALSKASKGDGDALLAVLALIWNREIDAVFVKGLRSTLAVPPIQFVAAEEPVSAILDMGSEGCNPDGSPISGAGSGPPLENELTSGDPEADALPAGVGGV